MLKKIGLAAAAAIGLSMLATPAMAQPEAPAVEAPAVEAPAAEAPAAEGLEALPPAPMPACQSTVPTCHVVWPQCSSAGQMSFPVPNFPPLPCGFNWSRGQLLSGGLGALLALCLDLNLHLRPNVLLGGGGCRSWSPC